MEFQMDPRYSLLEIQRKNVTLLLAYDLNKRETAIETNVNMHKHLNMHVYIAQRRSLCLNQISNSLANRKRTFRISNHALEHYPKLIQSGSSGI
jgi:hypothetical protein